MPTLCQKPGQGQSGLYIAQGTCNPGDTTLGPYTGAFNIPTLVPGQSLLPGGEIPSIHTPFGNTPSTNITPNVQDPAGSAGTGNGSAVQTIENTISNPTFWKRVALIGAGVLAIILGVVLFAGKGAEETANTTTGEVGKAALLG